MTVTNSTSGTNVHEIAPQIFRISTPIPPSQMPGGFTFNQILIVDEEPLLFHTGQRRMFPLVREAVAHVLVNRYPGRESADDITVFKSLGLGIQDIAVGVKVVEQARAHGLGREVEM